MSLFSLASAGSSMINGLLGGAGGGAKAQIKGIDASKVKIAFPFNPSEFKLSRAVNWSDDPTMEQAFGLLHFSNGQSDKLSMSFLLDTSEASGDISKAVNELYGLSLPYEISAVLKRPSLIEFTWASFRFLGVVASVDFDFLLFDPTGAPKRATVSMQLMGRYASSSKVTVDASPEKFFSQSVAPLKP
jgi:hypothetical protein